MPTSAKYHHLVPRAYLSAWADGEKALEVGFLCNDPEVRQRKNIENIAGARHYYSIKAGMPICTRDDAMKIFEVLAECVVEYEGEIVSDPIELNAIYQNFDDWRIVNNLGKPVKKRMIKNQIEQVKIRDIEENWGIQYETRWKDVVGKIEEAVLSCSAASVSPFEFEYLIAFYVMLDWRGFNSNEAFRNSYQKAAKLFLLDQVPIPPNEKNMPKHETLFDEFRHYYLLKEFRRFLDPSKSSGIMRHMVEEMMACMNLHFLVADGTARFFTCDTPAFLHRVGEGGFEGVLPISPQVLMVIGKRSGNDTNYLVDKVGDEVVREYNRATMESAMEFVVY